MEIEETVFFDSIERCRQDSEDGSSDSEDGGFSAHALASVSSNENWQERLTLHNLLVTSLLCLFFLFCDFFLAFFFCFGLCNLPFVLFFPCFLFVVFAFLAFFFTFYNSVLSFLPFFSSLSLIFVVLLSSGSLDSVLSFFRLFLPLLDLCCLFCFLSLSALSVSLSLPLSVFPSTQCCL